MRAVWDRAVGLGVVWWLSVLPAALVPVWLLGFILQGSPMQYGDYYYMLASIYSPSGRFEPSGLLVHANEHLVALPKLVYAANVALFAGSNITLGVFVWLLSAGILTVLWIGLRAITRPRSAARALALWAAVLTAFPLQALHNYVFSMSGTAWIMANLFVVLSVAIAAKGRSILAGISGVLATFSYGTGLVVWPLLLLVLAIRRRRAVWQDGVMVALGIGAVTVERLTGVAVRGHPPLDWNPVRILRSMAIAAGSLFTETTDLAVVCGIALLCAFTIAVGRLLPRGLSASETLLASVGVYGLVALALISLARSPFGDETFGASRYMTLSAFLAFGTVMVSLAVWGPVPAWRYATATGLALCLVATIPAIEHFKGVVTSQNIASVAARIGVAGNGYLRGYEPGSSALLETLQSYPFTSQFALDCGLLGQRVAERVRSDAQLVEGTIDDVATSPNPEAINVSGWAHSKVPIECVLLLSDDSTVIGAGVLGGDRVDVLQARGLLRIDVGWAGVARRPTGSGLRASVKLQGSDELYLLDNGRSVQVP